MIATPAGFAILVLFPDLDAANEARTLLDAARNPDCTTPLAIFVPPIRGLDFFNDPDGEVQSWWETVVPRDAYPIFLALHERELGEWVRSTPDADFYVGISDEDEAAEYQEADRLELVMARSYHDVLTTLTSDYATANIARREDALFAGSRTLTALARSIGDTIGDRAISPEEMHDVLRRRHILEPAETDHDALILDPETEVDPEGPSWLADPTIHLPLPPPVRPVSASPTPPGIGPGPLAGARSTPQRTVVRPTPAPSTAPDPWDLLRDATTPPPHVQALLSRGSSAGRVATHEKGSALRGDQGKQPKLHRPPTSRQGIDPTRLRMAGERVQARRPLFVLCGASKGGVGKSTYAEALGTLGGMICEQVGASAALADANLTNPNSWSVTRPDGVGTMRDVLEALRRGEQPPPPLQTGVPGLLVYPEMKDPTEYSKSDIRRLYQYLGGLYSMVVIDLANTLPVVGQSAAASAMAYWVELADVIVVPTGSEVEELDHALNFMGHLPDDLPVVVPYLEPQTDAVRKHPTVQRYLAQIEERILAHPAFAQLRRAGQPSPIIFVPAERDNVQRTKLNNEAIIEASPNLRRSYLQLIEQVVSAPARRPKP